MLPPHQPNNHAINLEEGKTLPYKRPYPMSKDKFLVVKKYINKYLDKGFISFSLLPITTSVLLVKKLKGGIWFYINYRGLNAIIIKN